MRRGRRAKAKASGRPNWVEKAGLAIAAVGVVIGIVALFVSSGSGSDGGASSASSIAQAGKLEAVDVSVHDVIPFERGRAFLEVTLHNTGGRRVVIDAARVEVRRVQKLRRCASQDDLLLSHVYGLLLPANAHEGDAVEMPLHQQVGPDEADRFRVELSTKLPPSDQTSLYLFEVAVSLRNDGPQSELPLGTAVVGLPELPAPGEYYWDAGTLDVLHNFALGEPDYARYLRQHALPCWRANTRALEQAGKGRKLRSNDLEEVVDDLVQPDPEALE